MIVKLYERGLRTAAVAAATRAAVRRRVTRLFLLIIWPLSRFCLQFELLWRLLSDR